MIWRRRSAEERQDALFSRRWRDDLGMYGVSPRSPVATPSRAVAPGLVRIGERQDHAVRCDPLAYRSGHSADTCTRDGGTNRASPFDGVAKIHNRGARHLPMTRLAARREISPDPASAEWRPTSKQMRRPLFRNRNQHGDPVSARGRSAAFGASLAPCSSRVDGVVLARGPWGSHPPPVPAHFARDRAAAPRSRDHAGC